MLSRRDFLRQSVTVVTAGMAMPPIFTQAIHLAHNENLALPKPGERMLLIVQMAGGNDGLNTIVPFTDPAYYDQRKGLSLTEKEVLPLDGQFAFHPALAALKPLWDKGVMSVVHGVGYPNPNLSHFRSMEIWQNANPESSGRIGWLGRWFDTTGITPDQQVMSWGFGLNLVLGGLLSMVVRELYKRFSSTLSNRETFANMLPLFTLATITVVSVVQYSPALALGLVGALSVIRFRAAIATGEELVYLLLCVGLGVAIGANHLPLAMVTVVVVAPFIFLRRRASKRHVEDNLMLTLSAQTTGFFDDDGGSVVDVVRNMTKGMTVERLEHSSGQVLFRARIQVENADQVVDLLTALRTRVSQCQVASADTNRP